MYCWMSKNNNYLSPILLLSIATTPIPRKIVMRMIIPHSPRVGISWEEIVLVVVGTVVVAGTVVVTGTEVVVGWVVVVVVVEIEVVVGTPGFVVACARTMSSLERVKIYAKRTAKSITGKYEPLGAKSFIVFICSIFALSNRSTMVYWLLYRNILVTTLLYRIIYTPLKTKKTGAIPTPALLSWGWWCCIYFDCFSVSVGFAGFLRGW